MELNENHTGKQPTETLKRRHSVITIEKSYKDSFQSTDHIIPTPIKEKSDECGNSHGIPLDHPTTYSETLMHILKGNIGSGTLAMGDAIRNSGLIFGPIGILILGTICANCQHMLVSSARKMEQNSGVKVRPDYAETVELCFKTSPWQRLRKLAKIMRKIINVFLCTTQWGFCSVYFLSIMENLQQVLDNYQVSIDRHLLLLIILIPILLATFIRNLKYLAPLSTIANISMLVGLIITIYYTTQGLPSVSERKLIESLTRFPLFFGTVIYAFEGIGIVLPAQNEMKEPKQFSKPLGVLNVSMAITIALFIACGIVSYWKFGNDIKGSVTLNLPNDEILAQIVKIFISFALFSSYTIQFYTPITILYPSISNKFGPFKYPICAELAFRTVIVLITFTLAEVIPYLSLFITLIGSLGSTTLALLMPTILDLMTSYTAQDLTFMKIGKNSLILIIGVFGCITGTYQSVDALITAFKEDAS